MVGVYLYTHEIRIPSLKVGCLVYPSPQKKQATTLTMARLVHDFLGRLWDLIIPFCSTCVRFLLKITPENQRLDPPKKRGEMNLYDVTQGCFGVLKITRPLRGQDTLGKMSNEKSPGCWGYVRDYTTHLYRDYFINHEIRIPINQPVFHGK